MQKTITQEDIDTAIANGDKVLYEINPTVEWMTARKGHIFNERFRYRICGDDYVKISEGYYWFLCDSDDCDKFIKENLGVSHYYGYLLTYVLDNDAHFLFTDELLDASEMSKHGKFVEIYPPN